MVLVGSCGNGCEDVERIQLFVERGRERIVWERIMTFCFAKDKEKLFDAKRLRISKIYIYIYI